MEKLCIVKRRQQYWQDDDQRAMQNDRRSTLKSDGLTDNTIAGGSISYLRQKKVEDFDYYFHRIVSIAMTKEQTNMLHKSEHLKEIMDGTVKNAAFNIKHNADGLMLLNLRVHESPFLRMLRSNQVCEILQISRSFLTRIIRDEKIRSFKLGRLRRFLWSDLLEYLQSSEQLIPLNKMK